MNMMRLPPLLALTLCAASFTCLAGSLSPSLLRCEYKVDPLGIDETAPRLSWIVDSTGRGESEEACQILVASSEKMLGHNNGDLWDSGQIEGGDTIGVVYQ